MATDIRRFPLAVRVCAVVLVLSCGARAKQQEYRTVCDDGVRALEDGRLDSAQSLFTIARSKGMPRDSLLYFWGEVYRRRGVLDTALALNLAVSPAPTGSFAFAVLKQRYLIYSALGWQEKASAILDSVKARGRYRRSLLAPRTDFGLTVGYQSLNETVGGAYPWNEYVSLDTTDVEHGVHGRADVRLGWGIPLKDGRSIALETGYAGTKPYYVQDHMLDSMKLNMTGYGLIRAEGLFDRLSLELRFGARRDYLGDYSSVDNIEATYIVPDARRLRVASAGYGIELGPGPDLQHQNVWLLGYLDNSIARGRGWSFSFLASGYSADAVDYSFSEAANVFYVDDVDADFVTHYTDSSYATMVDTTGDSVYQYVAEAQYTYDLVPLSSLYDSPIESTIPQDFLSAGPSVAYTYTFVKWLKGRAGMGWNMRYYPQQYEWVTLDRDEAEKYTSASSRLAYNRADGRYYLLQERIQPQSVLYFTSTDMSHVDERYEDTPAVFTSPQYRKVRRIDNEIAFNLSLESGIGAFGTLVLRGNISHTWSTLDNDAPVDVPGFQWWASLAWEKSIRPRRDFFSMERRGF
ncbi:MAG: hypothetical protein GF418_15270 [Chitinivibrionales bacterium]|nr:hypothetical protein [Chitinivibrionales bacterium]MBD3396982.1 hypothetical protein [Chitinivibrionales bacterium]